jgi:hypothetical protein
MTERTCATCLKPIPPQIGSGRPRTFCSAACRRVMADRRHELDSLEASLADAHAKEWGFWPGPDFWRTEVHRLELAIAELQARIPADALTSGGGRAR